MIPIRVFHTSLCCTSYTVIFMFPLSPRRERNPHKRIALGELADRILVQPEVFARGIAKDRCCDVSVPNGILLVHVDAALPEPATMFLCGSHCQEEGSDGGHLMGEFRGMRFQKHAGFFSITDTGSRAFGCSHGGGGEGRRFCLTISVGLPTFQLPRK